MVEQIASDNEGQAPLVVEPARQPQPRDLFDGLLEPSRLSSTFHREMMILLYNKNDPANECMVLHWE